jgi:hypothetical protein
MLRKTSELIGYSLNATDGDIGQVDDLYFDDESWHVRYFVINAGGYFTGRKVLIAPEAFGKPNWDEGEIPVELTRDQIEESPSIESDRPVSRQQQAQLADYFNWTPYWAPTTGPGAEWMRTATGAKTATAGEAEDASDLPPGDPHLRSIREVEGYTIEASDGEIGHVEDFLVGDSAWPVVYMVVDTRDWLPGKKVLVSPAWAEKIDWTGSRVKIDMTREEIKAGPEFDFSQPVTRDYEVRLHEYYDQPKYWENRST